MSRVAGKMIIRNRAPKSRKVCKTKGVSPEKSCRLAIETFSAQPNKKTYRAVQSAYEKLLLINLKLAMKMRREFRARLSNRGLNEEQFK